MHITPEWQNASAGFRVVDIALADHAQHTGGAGRGIEVRFRRTTARPAANDQGEYLLVKPQAQRLILPEGSGQALWLKAAATQFDVTIVLSQPEQADAGGLPTGGTTGQIIVKQSNIEGDAKWVDAPYALYDSPAFVGTPTAPTPPLGTNTTQLATTAFVAAADVAAGAGKAPLASPVFTGVPTAPTAATGTNTTQLATTAFVNSSTALKANIASPALTGIPTAPTAATGTSTAQLATTAFVAVGLNTVTAGSLTPEQFGAIGNGNVANMAADTHGWQMAINASASSGLPIIGRAATYIIDGHKGDNPTWTNTAEWKSGGLILRGGARIWGAGAGKTILKNGADRWRSVFRIREAGPVSLRDLTIDGDVGPTRRPVKLGGDGLETATEGDVRGECVIMEGEAHIQYYELRNLEIKNSGHYGIGIQNVRVDGGIIADCVFSNIGGDCIDVKSYPLPGNQKQAMEFRNIVSLDGAGHHWIGKYDPGEGHDDQTVVDLGQGCYLDGCYVTDLDTDGAATKVCGVRFRPASVSSPPRNGSTGSSATRIRVTSKMTPGTGNNVTNNVCCMESSCDGSHISDCVLDGGYRGLSIIAGADFTPQYGSITDVVIKNSTWDNVGTALAYGFALGAGVKGVFGRNILIQTCDNGARLDCTECDIDLRIEDSKNVQLQANDSVFDQNRIKMSFGRANRTPTTGDLNIASTPLVGAGMVSGVSKLAAVYGGELSLVQDRRAYVNLISTINAEDWTGDDPVTGKQIYGGIQVLSGDISGLGKGMRASIRALAQGPSAGTAFWVFSVSDGVGDNDKPAFYIGPNVVESLLPSRLPGYTRAELLDGVTLPPAAYVACSVYITDPVGNKRLAVSDASTWRYPDGTAVV